jgi:uncharacterized membrane protein YfhO
LQTAAIRRYDSRVRRHELKTFLIAVMSLLSVLVFFLGLARQDVKWLFISFLCLLISGVFVQLLINRRKGSG